MFQNETDSVGMHPFLPVTYEQRRTITQENWPYIMLEPGYGEVWRIP